MEEVAAVLLVALLWHESAMPVLYPTPLELACVAPRSLSFRLLPYLQALLICAEGYILKHTLVGHLLLSCKPNKYDLASSHDHQLDKYD